MTLTFKQYQEGARSTAIYPNIGSNIAYPTLGLAGECGELYSKLSSVHSISTLDDETREDLQKEVGDLFWYIASIASEFKISLGDFESYFYDSEAEYLSTNMGYISLPKSVGKVCERVKKILRDKNGWWVEADQIVIKKDLAEVLSDISAICYWLGFQFRDVAQANLDKLASRKLRGVLQGSGDNR